MNFDLSNLSIDELVQLSKMVKDEQNKRDKRYKSNVSGYDKFFDMFDKRFKKEGIPELSRMSTYSKLDSSVFRLCDIALGNYKINHKGSIQVNGSLILANPDTYQNMVDDIVAVVEKYAEW